RDSGARWLVTASVLLPTAMEAVRLLEAGPEPAARIEEVVVCDGAPGHRSLADLLASTDPEPHIPVDPPHDVPALPYSSGTTGTHKGVMLTHRNVATNLLQLRAVHRDEPGTRILAVLPFFHIYGLATLLNAPLRNGLTVVVLSRFDLPGFLAAIAEHRV